MSTTQTYTSKLDGRKIDHKTRETIRIRAVQQVQNGESPEAVIKALGFTRCCIYRWLAAYRAGGWDALKTGRIVGRPKKLTASQIRWIYQTVTSRNPLQLKFPFALWTRGMIRTLLWKKYRIRLSLSSIGRLLAQLGLTVASDLWSRPCNRIPLWSSNGWKRNTPEYRPRPSAKGLIYSSRTNRGCARISMQELHGASKGRPRLSTEPAKDFGSTWSRRSPRRGRFGS